MRHAAGRTPRRATRARATPLEHRGTHVATLAAGDDFGEAALVGDGKRHATVVTTTPTSLLCIARDVYQATSRALREVRASARGTSATVVSPPSALTLRPRAADTS